MLLHIPHGVLVRHGLVGHHLVLVEAPGGQLAAAEAQRGARLHVHEAHERADAVPRGALVLAVHDLHAPQVLRRHRHVVVDVARHLLGITFNNYHLDSLLPHTGTHVIKPEIVQAKVMATHLCLRRHGRGDVVRVERPARDAVQQLHQLAVPHHVGRAGHGERRALRPLHDPPVVDVLETVARDLLLVRRAAPVRVAHRVHVRVRVQPARAPVRMSASIKQLRPNHFS